MVTGLIQGTYLFQLSANGGASISQVTITVNPAPPAANAGPDQTITLPTSSVSLDGSGSTGFISSYTWTRVSGPNTPSITESTAESTTVTGLIEGTYIFQLSVNGGASTSQVTITVDPEPPPPVANAGPDQTITLPVSSVTLNGSGSTGGITSYSWTSVSGPNIPGITTPTAMSTTVTGLIQGTYLFQISLNGGASTSQVTITVNPAPPLANAGSNQSITLPASSVTLNGNGSTGTITSYSWTYVSGPFTPTITTPTAMSTTITGLVEGLYVFQLSVNGGASTSQVTITVNAAAPPGVADAGLNQTITLPTSSVTLDGSGSTGTITSYSWTRVSGPNTPTITAPTAVSTTVTGLIQGTYVFQCSVNGGASNSQVTITVNAAPVANAGTNQTITLPITSVTLDASGSTGTITSYSWTRVSGPNTPTITTPTTVSTTVTGLIQGTYVFQLSVNGAASTSQVTITVNAAPVANAGPNQTITLPTSSVTLDGSGTTGTITSYSWTRVSGPNTPTITTPTAVSTTVTGLIQGTYVFQLSVNGGASTSQVTITVSAAPVANAGPNQTIMLPTSSVTLSGSASTGNITSYSWTRVSGPNTPTITTPTALSTTVTGLVQGTYVFQLSVNGGASTSQVTITVNAAPVANSGPSQTITLPTSSVTLSGSGSTGTITSYSWTRVSGPNTPTITAPTAVSTTVTGLIQGTYVFQLSVNGAASTSQVTITVNAAPVANAGPNQTITLPTSSVTLNGSGSTGTITSYSWTRVSGPNTPTITAPTAVSTTVTGLIQGTYVFQLSVNGAASTSQVTITVNAAPVANAGPNQTINLPTSSVTLNGSGSTGTITSYSWTRLSGPNTPTITTPTAVSTTVTGLIQGTYVFQLSVNGAASTSQVTITVNASTLVANAGPNQTITLPISSVTLNGSGSTGTITSYLWTRVSGPNTPTITTPTAVSTTVTGLIQGTYTFRLSVNGAASTSQVTITVNSATPVANAGANQTITLPTSSVTLNGSASTGTITSYLWTRVSGPNTPTITTPTAVSTTVTGLVQGTYTFRLSVNGAASTSQVTITVNAATLVANAGPNQTITLPTSSVTLNGSGSTGTITSYSWTRVSGPNTPTITTPTAVSTTVTGLIQGTYTFRLTLNGGSSTSQVTITVNAAPVANAGPNQTITLPTSSVTLNGSGSTGTITSYSWTRVSGPNTPTITTPTAVSTTVTGLIQGTYTFRLSLNGGSSTSQVTITVNAATLVANAGPNQTITLPTSSVTLNGSGSTGTITSYSWTRVSGPNTPTITTPTAVSTTVTGLIQGTYTFRLSLNGGSSTSQVTITVNAAPVANAGATQTITLPTSSVTLNGSGSTGTITSYSWTRVSGPNTPTITAPTAVSTTVTGLIQGTYVFQLSVNGGASTSQVTINVVSGSSGANIFTTQTPTTATENDGQAVELGVKFRSSVAGTITGIRFYKTTGNSGTHIGELYSSTGTRLAQATFVGETASGWQQVLFATPVSISANTTYVAAYFSSAGNYVSTSGYFASAVVNGSLTALADGTDGVNGSYRYTTTPAFPTTGYQKSNYWVDVIFNAGTSGNATRQMQITGEVVTLDTAQTQIKLEYQLGQNHPNPFSENTKINYSIPSPSFVEIVLFDIHGRLLKVLVNEMKETGNYVYELRKANLAAGIYYYRMRAGNYTATRKLMIQ